MGTTRQAALRSWTRYRGFGNASDAVSASGRVTNESRFNAKNRIDLSDNDRSRLAAYGGDAIYTEINSGLRSGKLNPVYKKTVASLDSSISKSKISDDILVHRGIATKDPSKFKPGQTISDKGFSSTTFNQSMGQRFANQRADELRLSPVVMNIQVHKGKNALVYDANTNGLALNEGEVILPRNAKIKIMEVKKMGGYTAVNGVYL